MKERKSNRLKNYDYSKNDYYFITICTKDRIHYFGEIRNGKMILNKFGKIIKQQWLCLENRFDYVKLDEFVMMQNHIHGILIIDKNDIAINSINHSNPTNRRDNHKDNAFSIVRMVVPTTTHNKQDNLLSKTMNVFKTKSSKLIHLNNLKQFKWQRSFHDHIIRNRDELNKIRIYIRNNPISGN